MSWKHLESFLTDHVISKDSPLETTHTEFSKFSSRKFHIPEDTHEEFLRLYNADILKPNKCHHLIERQLIEKGKQPGAILIDVDLRLPNNQTERCYQKSNIEDFIQLYLNVLSQMFEMDEDVHFLAIVQEKPSPRMEIKETGNVMKDGLHIIISVAVEKRCQQWIRKQVIQHLPTIWKDIPIINTWEDVLDDSITNGSNGWLLPNSKKRDDVSHYDVSLVWDVHYDVDSSAWKKHLIYDAKIHPRESFLSKHYKELSPRYKSRPKMSLLKETMEQELSSLDKIPEKTRTIFPVLDMGSYIPLEVILSISNQEELDTCFYNYLDSLSVLQHDLVEVYEYANILPISYYGPGSYNRWIRMGFAFRNTHISLLIAWIKISSKSSSFHFSDIPKIVETWNDFSSNPQEGITKYSLIYWAKNDAPEGYTKVRENTIDFHLDQSIDTITLEQINNPKKKHAKGSSDFDIASVLYQLKKGEYIACSIKLNDWFRFVNHRWSRNDCGTSLRKAISTELRMLYHQKARALSTRAMAIKTPEGDIDVENEEYKLIMGRANKVLDIAMALGSTKDKDNIMKEARELFYDPDFLEKLDQKCHLLCMENGVIDFTEKTFRKGNPEDYLSKCTKVKYIPIDEIIHRPIMDEIEDYMRKLFPVAELCQYMWDHLCSVLMGDSCTKNTCLHYYTGIGQNGKSILVKLMQKVLGDYAAELDVAYFTNERPKRGQSTPEVYNLLNTRFAVTAEPSEGDRLNEGPMKQLTGSDEMSCRPLYGQLITFTPQANCVIMANHFLDIKSRDHGTWRRIRVVDFMSLFTDNPVEGDKDKPYQFKKVDNFDKKFEIWVPIFLSMLINRAYITGGSVKICNWVENASNKYKRKKDYIAEFLDQYLEADPKSTLKKTEVNLRFTDWYVSEFGGRATGKTQELHSSLDKLYGECKAGVGWTGVKIKSRNDYSDIQTITTNDSLSDDFDTGKPIF
jgi:P4 family phage/plasmid primase-like protien